MGRDRRNVRLSLASLDSLGSDAELRAQADRALDQTEGHRQPSTYVGQDRSGSIAVLVDKDGQVEDVTVEREWRSRVGVGSVADALFEAYTTALHAAVEAAALRQLQAGTDREFHPAPEASSVTADGLDDHLWLRQTWQVLRQNDADLDQLARLARGVSEQHITSRSGCLTLRLRDGSVAAITGDARRIAQLDAAQLRYDAHSLFRSYALARSRNRS